MTKDFWELNDVEQEEREKILQEEFSKIKVNETGNPTPNRNWDYVAYIDGMEEEGPNGLGKTPEIAIQNLKDILEEELD